MEKRSGVRFIGLSSWYPVLAGNEGPDDKKEAAAMRGYFTGSGYYGLVDGRYMLFAGEAEYYEYLADHTAGSDLNAYATRDIAD